MTITKADVERLAGQLDAWQSLVASRYECPAAAQPMLEAAIMLTELWAEVERLRWQPIETAPRDGTEVLLGSLAQEYQGKPVAPRSTIGHWATDEECREKIGDCGGECRCPEYIFHEPYWMSWDGGFTEENPPTHWMPLPVPPQALKDTPA